MSANDCNSDRQPEIVTTVTWRPKPEILISVKVDVQNILEFVEQSQLRWCGHVKMMSDGRTVATVDSACRPHDYMDILANQYQEINQSINQSINQFM